MPLPLKDKQKAPLIHLDPSNSTKILSNPSKSSDNKFTSNPNKPLVISAGAALKRALRALTNAASSTKNNKP